MAEYLNTVDIVTFGPLGGSRLPFRVCLAVSWQQQHENMRLTC